MGRLPLDDLRVVDLTLARAGPTAVRQLADFGADVVRIERPVSAAGVDLVHRRHGHDYQNLHRNKRVIALDLKRPEGLEVFHRLVERSDVLVENMRPGVTRRLGIDWPTLEPRNPRLVYASISGFGQSGPWAERGGVDQIAQGMSGLMSVTGEPDGEPTRTGAAITDVAAGLYLAGGILVALHERQRTGRGQWVHTSLLEAGIGLMDFQAARWLVEGEVPDRRGNQHPTLPPMGTFPTRDGRVNLAGAGDRLFRELCVALELEELAEDPDFATVEDRQKQRGRLEERVRQATRRFTTAEVVERLARAGVPAGPVYGVDETFADPQVEHLGIAEEVRHPRLGDVRLVAQPVHRVSEPRDDSNGRARPTVRSVAPERAENSREILAELGFGAARVDELARLGIVDLEAPSGGTEQRVEPQAVPGGDANA